MVLISVRNASPSALFFSAGVLIDPRSLANCVSSLLKALAFSPTISLGVGARIYNTKTSAYRIQLRDDLVLQGRAKTSEIQSLYFKHNLMLSFGYTILR